MLLYHTQVKHLFQNNTEKHQMLVDGASHAKLYYCWYINHFLFIAESEIPKFWMELFNFSFILLIPIVNFSI